MQIIAAKCVTRLAFLALFMLGCVASSEGQGEAIARIVGPVIPMGQSPWPWYDKAEQGNADELMAAALGAKPTLGPAAAGTFTFANGCPVTVTGPGVGEFQPGDWAVVAWNAPDGPGTGHFVFHNVSISGQTMSTADRCGFEPGLVAGTNLRVYHCKVGCMTDTETYKAGAWGLNAGFGSASWNYYDTGLAIYRMYLRTGDTKYLTQFRDFTDTWWTWALDQGSTGFNPPRALSLVSQYVRALDGHPERLPVLYNYVKMGYETSGFAAVTPPTFDARETGYLLIFLAVGARADTHPARHASYCSMLAANAQQWITTQTPEGYWSEKNGQYAYRPPGTSPWRMFAPIQGLARAYDVLIDTTASGCNNPALAGSALTAITKAVDFTYLYGRADNRGIFYDVEYPNAGQEGTNAGLKPGTLSIALGSSTVTGTGTTFRTTFACNGTDWIGIAHDDGFTWTYKVQSCADNNHLTIGGTWGDQGEKATAISARYYQTVSASTNCGASLAKTCWSGFTGNPLPGDRNSARDLIWAHGWLFNVTGNPIYKTRGDELFSASYGGPAGGPGIHYPNDPGKCGGPACDGVETDYAAALHGCAANTKLPCNAESGFAHNVYLYMAKRFAQGSGIGGADNYLAWRVGAATPPRPPGRR